MEMDNDPKLKKKQLTNLLEEDRFKAVFENPDFQIDKNSEQYALMNPIISNMGKLRKTRIAAAEEEKAQSAVLEQDDDQSTLFLGKNSLLQILLQIVYFL